MPHIIVKLYPGRSEQQKSRLTATIVENVVATLGSGEEAVLLHHCIDISEEIDISD